MKTWDLVITRDEWLLVKTEAFLGLKQLLFRNHNARVSVNNTCSPGIPEGAEGTKRREPDPCCPSRQGNGEKLKKGIFPGQLGSSEGAWGRVFRSSLRAKVGFPELKILKMRMRRWQGQKGSPDSGGAPSLVPTHAQLWELEASLHSISFQLHSYSTSH